MDKNKAEVKAQKKGKKEIAGVIIVGFLLALIPFIIIILEDPTEILLVNLLIRIGVSDFRAILILFFIYAIPGAVLYSNSVSSKFGERKEKVRFLAKSLIAGAIMIMPLTFLFPMFYHPLLTCDGGGGIVTAGGNNTTMLMANCIRKPVVYLYPEKSMPARVNVEILNGYFTKTDPPIDAGNGWDVIANPNGEMTQNGKPYPYLFYEANAVVYTNENEGWVVRGDNISNWFDVMLPKMGLSEKEKNDFTDYWSQHLPQANYYRIRLLASSELDRTVKLNIQPEPDTVIRVILVIEKLDKCVETVEPNIITPERKGFTAVEWGVILK